MASASSNGWDSHMHEEKIESNGILATRPAQKDTNYIEKLERELRNCYQEIDYLQDQLNLRSSEASFMGEHVNNLERKLREIEKINEKLCLIEIELQQSELQCLGLTHELEYKEEELQKSALQVQKLEMLYLDSQCEIESLKLDMNELEERLFESREATSKLESENKELNLYKLGTSRLFSTAEAQIGNLLEKLKVHLGGDIDDGMLQEMMANFCSSDYIGRVSEEPLSSLSSKLAIIATYDQNVEVEMNKMRNKVKESEALVRQLKEELQDEKRKAKEDAEDLTQEMAEMRYQMTGMLDEECKHRALIETASIKQINELEDQVMKEHKKATSAIKRYQEAHELAERQTLEIKRLKSAIERLHSEKNPCRRKRIDSCTCGFCAISLEQPDLWSKGPSTSEFPQALLEWRSCVNSNNEGIDTE